MQRKLNILIRILLTASLACVTGKLIAQESSPSLEQALRDTGWSVQRETDGSLILHPEAASQQSSANSYWLKVQNELKASGWGVERETDGSLVLIPPVKDNSEVAQQALPDVDPMKDMRDQLTQAGWSVTSGSDGSMLLYPPQDISAQPEPDVGVAPTITLSLPVDSWKEARELSQSWLDKQPPYQASIGKIRKIFRIYLVSIVSDTAPHNLLQQIAIRSSDGAVIVLN